MENCGNWEQKMVANEIIQGMEMAKQLKVELNSSSYLPENSEVLLQRILSSYEKALLVLKWRQSASAGEIPVTEVITGSLESPISVDGSLRSDDFDEGLKGKKNGSKKRKMMSRWTDQVKVSCETGLDGPYDDGYSWRKYGQKDILGAIYPRSYYRCTFRNTRNCSAIKQVQRSDEDPSIFDIRYRGTHTCNNNGSSHHSIPAPSSPEKETTHLHHEIPFPLSIPSTPENKNYINSYSSYFSTDDDSNYLWLPPSKQMTHYTDESISATNSPIGDLDFSLDPVELDSYIPFETIAGFFS